MLVFCFLTYDEVVRPEAWEEFFRGVDPARYAVCVHAKQPRKVFDQIPLFRDGVIAEHRRVKETAWGTYSLVRAQNRLLEAACEATQGRVTHCLLLSCTSIPLEPFELVYRHLTEWLGGGGGSVFGGGGLCDATAHLWRYDTLREPGFPREAFCFQSQWCILCKRDVDLILAGEAWIEAVFGESSIPDEHAYVNFLQHRAHVRDYACRYTTFADFDCPPPVPRVFEAVGEALVRQTCADGCLFLRKVSRDTDLAHVLERLRARKLPADFCAASYVELHPDLAYFATAYPDRGRRGQAIAEHFLASGRQEGRSYRPPPPPPADFSPTHYRARHRDLAHLSDREVAVHYVLHGAREGREYLPLPPPPPDFDPRVYLLLHPDLKTGGGGGDNQWLAAHYVLFGAREGRAYRLPPDTPPPPPDFCARVYKILHHDLRSLTDDEALYHFLQHGRREGRKHAPRVPFHHQQLLQQRVHADSYPRKSYRLLEVFEKKEKKEVKFLRVQDTADGAEKFVSFPFSFSDPDPDAVREVHLDHAAAADQRQQWPAVLIHRPAAAQKPQTRAPFLRPVQRFDPGPGPDTDTFRAHMEILAAKGGGGGGGGGGEDEDEDEDEDGGEHVLVLEGDVSAEDGEELRRILGVLDRELFHWDVFLGGCCGVGDMHLRGAVYCSDDLDLWKVANVGGGGGGAKFAYYNRRAVRDVLACASVISSFSLLDLFTVYTSPGVCGGGGEQLRRLKREENEWLHHLPGDFDADLYRELYGDLAAMSGLEARRHYLLHGRDEGRLCHFAENCGLPPDFDATVYIARNVDLHHLSENQAKLHFLQHGRHENRVHGDRFFCRRTFLEHHPASAAAAAAAAYPEYLRDIRQTKNTVFHDLVQAAKARLLPAAGSGAGAGLILLVNHDKNPFGASHYLFLLYRFLVDTLGNAQRVVLCEVEASSAAVRAKFGVAAEDVVEYHDDPTLLYLLCRELRPRVVYLNSCNFAMSYAYPHVRALPRTTVVLHSHEVREHYLFADAAVPPDFVVSQRIADQYRPHYQHPRVQPPFLLHSVKTALRDATTPPPPPAGDVAAGCGQRQRIVVGMCGEISERKNYALFAEMAAAFPQHDFLWIGGDRDKAARVFFADGPRANLFHVPTTPNPHYYFARHVDYFVLFSVIDPCPYVVLENILLETPTITFAHNIFYDHKHPLTEPFYHEIPEAISRDSCRRAIETLVRCKKPAAAAETLTGAGAEYIRRFFGAPGPQLLDLLLPPTSPLKKKKDKPHRRSTADQIPLY